MAKEQAQAVPETTTAVPDKGTDVTVSQPDLGDASLEQLDELMTTGKLELKPEPASGGEKGQETTGKAAEPAKPEVEKPAAEVKTEEPGEQPTPEVKTEEPGTPTPEKPATEPEGELPDRFRYKDPTDRAINAVYKAAKESGTPISWAEAEKRVKGEPVAQEEVKPPVTSDTLKGTVTTLTSEVTSLETELDGVTAEIDKLGEDEQLFGPEHSKALKKQADLTKKLNAKSRELNRAELDLRDVESTEKVELAREHEQHLSGREKSKKRAIELYPDAADENSPLGKAVAERITKLRNPKDPDHSTLYADSAPLTVTATVAAELGIAPKTKTSPPTAKPAATTQPRTTASPPSAAKTAVKEGKPAEDAKKTIEYLRSDAASLEDLDAAFGAGKNPLLVPS